MTDSNSRAVASPINFSARQVTLKSAAILVPICLLLAHFTHGADLPLTSAIFSLFLLLIYAALTVLNGLKRLPWGMLAIATLFGLWALLGGFGQWQQARIEVQALSAAGAIAGIGYYLGRHSASLNFAWSTLIYTLLLHAVLAFFMQFELTANVPSSDGAVVDQRLRGGFGSPNTAATLYAIATIAACAKIFLRIHDGPFERLNQSGKVYYVAQHEWASIALFVFAQICLFMTVSRAGIFVGTTFLVGLIVIELFRTYRRGRLNFLRRQRVVLPIAAILSGALAMTTIGAFLIDDSSTLNSNVEGRLSLFSLYIETWLQAPIFGHGLGSFNAVNDQLTTLDSAGAMVQNGSAHNIVLHWLLQQGIVGTLIMISVWVTLHVPLVESLRIDVNVPRHFVRMTLFISGIVAFHSMADYAMEIPSVMWTYAFVLGLAIGFAHQIQGRNPDSSE